MYKTRERSLRASSRDHELLRRKGTTMTPECGRVGLGGHGRPKAEGQRGRVRGRWEGPAQQEQAILTARRGPGLIGPCDLSASPPLPSSFLVGYHPNELRVHRNKRHTSWQGSGHRDVQRAPGRPPRADLPGLWSREL